MRIALAGNPNSGKTTMFNALTGSSEKVGNWAGVTVEKKTHPIKKIYTNGADIIAVDLPGAYSMSPFTSEESVTSSYVKNENPDAIINIVDATNLSRSLFFTTQLLELGIPVVVALNKADINEKKETTINTELLRKALGCPVVDTVSLSGEGLDKVVTAATQIIGNGQKAPYVQGDIDLSDKKSVEEADRKRFDFVNKIVKQVEKRKVHTNEKNFQDKIDAVITNKWVGIPLFALVMYAVFWVSQAGPAVWLADWLVGILERVQGSIGEMFVNASPLLYALLIDGVIGGAIAVIGFLPLVMVMYFLIALLEDCGYMARATVVLDPIFKKVGLSGKSVIPFIITTGCAVPGVMASRTIRNERERRATAMLAPFMPCGAKLPVIALFAGAFFDDAPWVGATMYLAGIVLIFLCALLVNKVTAYKARKSFFIIELPEYKFPSIWGAFKSMCQRGWSYIVKAATIILLCNTVVQIMQSFTWSFTTVEEGMESTSILASIAGPFAYIIYPVVGVLSWQLAAAAVTGFIAKENVVGTLAVCFGVSNFFNLDELAMLEGAGADVQAVMGITSVAALAYLMFNLFTPPCFAAIGAMNAEMKSAKWLFAGIGLQLAVGFTVGYLVYTIGTLIVAPATLNVGGAIAGLIAVLAMAAVIVMIAVNSQKKLKAEYELKKKGN
ncbi:MAG: ferrous iron transporter B [Clostridia bacterium]|nr:ferrous iron transporter B [Clostridia bacterium]